MHLINNLELIHGLAVLPVQQTSGVGRRNNQVSTLEASRFKFLLKSSLCAFQWLSPPGCAMFSLQLHLTMDSALSSRLPLLQHLVGTAIVNSLRSHEEYGVSQDCKVLPFS